MSGHMRRRRRRRRTAADYAVLVLPLIAVAVLWVLSRLPVARSGMSDAAGWVGDRQHGVTIESLAPSKLLALQGPLPAPTWAAPGIMSDPSAVETFKRLDAEGGDWYRGRIGSAIAWGQSYVLMAYLIMYEATGDTSYLDRFVRHARPAVTRTDRALGLADYRGQSLPAWRTSGHYTVAKVALPDAEGHPVLGVSACFSRCNDDTRVRILRGSDAANFTLAVRNPLEDPELYRDVCLDPSKPNYVGRRVNDISILVRVARLRHAVRYPEAVPAPSEYRRPTPLDYHFACHTGMVTYPLARFYNLVMADQKLHATYETDAARFARAAVQAVRVHDDEWVDEGSYGYYKRRRGAPVWADGIELPHNKQLALGRTLIELYRATGSREYLVRATKLARTLRMNLKGDGNGAYLWNYWWGRGDRGWTSAERVSVYTPSYRGLPRYEDISHSSIDVDFAVLAARNGVVFTQDDLVRFAKTFNQNHTRADGSISFYCDGTGDEGAYATRVGIAGWISLSIVSPDVYITARRVLASRLVDKRYHSPALLYGVAQLVKARRAPETGRRALGAPTVTDFASTAGR